MSTKKNFLSYEEAAQLCKENKIASPHDYRERYKEFKGLPSNPNITYKKSWTSWTNFFGKKYVTFEEAKQICHDNGIGSYVEYINRYKEFPGLPSSTAVYKEFRGWSDFIGKQFFSYDEAREILKEKHIITTKLYRLSYKKLSESLEKKLPSNPNIIYKDNGWVSWKEFFKDL